MSEKQGGISQTASGSSGVTQQAAIGNNNQQLSNSQSSASETDKALSTTEVMELLNQISDFLRFSDIPEMTKDDAMAYLNAAKKATEQDEPKKETAAINLKEMAATIENANKTVTASENLWTQVQPSLVRVAKWLGVAAGGLWSYLP